MDRYIEIMNIEIIKCKRKTLAIEVKTAEEIRSLAYKALKVIPKRVEYYAKIMGVTYGRITQRKKWLKEHGNELIGRLK